MLYHDDLQQLSTFIQDTCGIKLPPAKRIMLESRLQKRLRALGMNSIHDYREYLFSDEGKNRELVNCIDAVTTNKTDFFRESPHFDLLLSKILPEWEGSERNSGRKPYSVWSAGCSTGEEPYTLAMVLSEFAETVPGFDFSILATDISTRVLDKARLAVYDEESVAPVPAYMKSKYLLRSRDQSKNLVRLVPRLRQKVLFQRLNFMDHRFAVPDALDAIFCRNVMIYFDRNTQEKLVRKFCRHLAPGGYLFLGHSETLNNMDVPLAAAAMTVYRMPK